MKRVDIKANFNCNNRCRFCVQGNKRDLYPAKTTEEIKKILKETRKTQDGLVFTGGEVTIRDDIVELVKYAKQMKYKTIQIQSNGRMFCYGKFCDQMIAAGANQFSPALHGHTPKLHDYLTCVKGSFFQTVTGIKNLKKRGQEIIINCVVTKPNYRHLPQIAKLLVSLGVNQFQFAFVHAGGSANQNFDSIVPRKTLVMPYVREGLDIGIKAGIAVMAEAIPYCFMKGYEKHVAEKYIPSTKIYDADLVIDDFTESRQKQGKAKGLCCKECKYDKICEGPWKEYPEKFGWSEFKPVKNKEKIRKPGSLFNAIDQIFDDQIKRSGLSSRKKTIYKIKDIVFDGFDFAWLSQNQKFDFSFSQGAKQFQGLRFCYNNFGESDGFDSKIIGLLSLFKKDYNLDCAKKVLRCMDFGKYKHQTTIGMEWLKGNNYPRFKVYFEELFHVYSKKQRFVQLKNISEILNIKLDSLDIKQNDNIGTIGLDFLPDRKVNLKVYLLCKGFVKTKALRVLKQVKACYAGFADVFVDNFIGDSYPSFYYLAKSFDFKGKLLSLKLYKIYEVSKIKDQKKLMAKLELFFKNNSLKNLSEDIRMLGNVCRKNNVNPYPVIVSLDRSLKQEKIDLYCSFR